VRCPWLSDRRQGLRGSVGALGFPLLTSFALTAAPASHGAVVVGLPPAATAVMAVLRGREQASASFWTFAALGAVAVVTFAALRNGGLGALHSSDVLLFGAVLAAAVGYAEGGLLARELGSRQTVSWAPILAAPVMSVPTVASVVHQPPSGTPVQWLAFAYLCASRCSWASSPGTAGWPSGR
jgi:drug/metabolite transporter (DMT)-like permease